MSFQEKDFNILIYLYREIMILLINIREIIQSINIFKLIFGNMFILSLRSKIRFFKFLFQQKKNYMYFISNSKNILHQDVFVIVTRIKHK